MARESEDREDLLADATGLPVRGELSVAAKGTVIVGFRGDRSASWFFGADPVFQFDPQHRLRRIYCDGVKYAVAGGVIVRLVQTPSNGRIQLTKEPLSEAEAAQLMQRWQSGIATVRDAIETNTHRWIGASVDIALLEIQVVQWLRDLPALVPIAKGSRLPRSSRK